LSFDWSDYLTLANELAPRPVDRATAEARLRSAVSRAYYANYCKARNYLRDQEGCSIPREDAHRFVIEQFIGSDDRKRRDIGKDLNRLKIDRIRADYQDEFNGLAAKTETVLILAGQVSEKLEKL
jgi:hypothetical protein